MLLLATILLAADIHDWANVPNDLHQGDKVQVVKTDKKSLEGAFAGASASGLRIVVRATGSEVEVPKDEVFRVSRSGSAHRVRNAILLGAIGAAAGAGAKQFGLACAESNTGCRDTALATAAGGGAGAAIGALLPGGFKVIYRKP